MKETIIRKLTSRKFWVAICGFVTELAVAFGADASSAAQVAAIIMAGATVVAYIVGEGLVDAAREDAVLDVIEDYPEGEIEG